MIKYENQCVSCGLPCVRNACRHYNVRILECDKCREEVEKLYRVDGEEVCEECLLEEFEVIT